MTGKEFLKQLGKQQADDALAIGATTARAAGKKQAMAGGAAGASNWFLWV